MGQWTAAIRRFTSLSYDLERLRLRRRSVSSVFESTPVFGLRIGANTSLPGLTKASVYSSPDISLVLRESPDWLKTLVGATSDVKFSCPDLDEKGQPFFTLYELSGGAFYRLCYCDGADFVVDRAGTRIWADWPDSLTPEDISEYLFGPVIGWVLRLRGDVCLHASAVAIDGAAAAFVGTSGSGKSTTAAALSEREFPLVADDVVAVFGLTDRLLVRPGYPELRLWPGSLAALGAIEDHCIINQSTGDKFRLSLREHGRRFQTEPLPLAAVYILNNDDPDGQNEIRALAPRDALIALIANTHAGRLLNRTARKGEFELLAELVARVRVREICRSSDIARLPQLCEAILSDFKNESAPALEIKRTGT